MRLLNKIRIVICTFLILIACSAASTSPSLEHSNPQTYDGPCPASCVCTLEDSLHLECHNSQTKAIGLPPEAGFISYNFMTHDDFHRPAITRATSVRHLAWRHSRITTVTEELFSNLHNLTHLDLSHNQIATIDEAALQHLTSLRSINISNNAINFLPHGLFLNNHHLNEVYVANNYIQSVPFHALAPLKELRVLDLSYNRLNEIQDDIFVLNRKVHSILLHSNLISRLSERTFHHLYDLKSLNLVNNSLTELPKNLFKDLVKLTYLNLASNSIHTLLPDAYKGLVQLRWLNISDNPLSVLPARIFQYSPQLETLWIDTTNIEVVEKHTFNGLRNLKELSMKDNMHLEDLEDKMFDDIKKLNYLDLSRNNLTTLPHSLGTLKNLTNLNISQNPWMCDCRMVWFPSWLEPKKNMTFERSNLRCASTLFSLRGLSLVPTLRGLDCKPPELIFSTSSEKYILKSTALLQCIYSGYPPPSITWLTPNGLTFHWNPNVALPDEFAKHPTAHYSDMSPVELTPHKFHVTENGSLHIVNITRADAGLYTCFASNPMANATNYIRLMIDPITMHEEKLISIAVGMVTALLFLGISLLVNLFRRFIHIFACFACCKKDQVSPKGRQVYQMMESIETYKTQQLDKLKENYTSQVHRIKENCAQQVEWIRESYQSQMQHLKDFRDFGTSHLTSMRDQYCDQIKRVREYSASQLNWVKENYVFQRNRIRKFSSHQILRFRESYKYQQATLGKLMETLPSLYLDNCRNGSCGKTESGVFEVDINQIDMYMKANGMFPGMSTGEGCADDNLSRLSIYYTPSEISELQDPSLEPLKSPYFSPMSRSSSKQPNFRFGFPPTTSENQRAVFQSLEKTLERQLRDYITREHQVQEAAPSALVPSSSLPEIKQAVPGKGKSRRAHYRSASTGGVKSVTSDTSISRQIPGKHSVKGKHVANNAVNNAVNSAADYSCQNGHAVAIQKLTEVDNGHAVAVHDRPTEIDQDTCRINMDQEPEINCSPSHAAHETAL
ncbi:immunoglobulin domain and leucine-rich repeat-containing protein 2 [Thrips palmi]|uniref:Immunoglobulin domain and leucine-rich repeat-containing protein 2 n=1 Tax=Thrips palmi TaxID=161013 RepID=A0A6P8ZMV4_THRPL|nr:immunoglobulin domain and leucine-rich repeat-containing protein 2 [Thrips palmi]XP_034241260.1 immunoglobulin domain and leucine-rich repeat-containing protein 2 [Thrips palmi]